MPTLLSLSDIQEKLANLRQVTDTTLIMFRASENWAQPYRQHADSFKRLLKMETRLERKMKRYFRDLSKQTSKLVNWQAYQRELQGVRTAFDVRVTVNDDEFADQISILVNYVYDDLADGAYAGAQAQQALVDHGLTESVSSAIEKEARAHAADLAKGLTKTTKSRVQDSIATSLQLGEPIASATDRLTTILNDKNRASMIARTESVRAYNTGSTTYAQATGASSKTWDTVDDPCPICAALADETVAIDDDYSSGDDGPPAHVNCRCGQHYTYDSGEIDDSADE